MYWPSLPDAPTMQTRMAGQPPVTRAHPASRGTAPVPSAVDHGTAPRELPMHRLERAERAGATRSPVLDDPVWRREELDAGEDVELELDDRLGHRRRQPA